MRYNILEEEGIDAYQKRSYNFDIVEPEASFHIPFEDRKSQDYLIQKLSENKDDSEQISMDISSGAKLGDVPISNQGIKFNAAKLIYNGMVVLLD